MPHRPAAVPLGRYRAILAVPLAGLVTLGLAGSHPASTHWRVFKSIAVRGTMLAGVVALPDGTAWAAGQSASEPLLYQWTAGRWHSATLPEPAGTSVTSIAGTSATNVWATIQAANAVAHLTASGWHVTSFGAVPAGSADAVVTTGPKDTWVFTANISASKGTAHHFNGSSWRTVPLPGTALVRSGTASASSARNVWTWVYNPKTGTYETVRYDGTHWKVVKLPPLTPTPEDVLPQGLLAVSASNVWATGYAHSLGSVGPVVLLHWQKVIGETKGTVIVRLG